MSLIKRRQSMAIQVGGLQIGSGAPVLLQSMTNTKTEDTDATLAQIKNLADAGCELVRVAVPGEAAAFSFSALTQNPPIPVIADIHFDIRLAHLVLERGAAEIRINPGNIGGKKKLRDLARAAADYGAAIRVGVNAGSLERSKVKKHAAATAEAMVESALDYLQELEKAQFQNVEVSLKASDVPATIEANRLFASQAPYPLHIGITEAGTVRSGTVKGAVGIGTLLAEGIGDTIRVSLTADPLEEIKVGRMILQSLKLREFGPELISCPTCGRCEIDLVQLADKVAEMLEACKGPYKVAVMGCAVNGPGEAREAAVGVSVGKKRGIIFRNGKVIKIVKQETILDVLRSELNELEKEYRLSYPAPEAGDPQFKT